METAINKLDGVNEATVNFLTQKMTIVGEDEKMPTIIDEAQRIIKKLESQVVVKKA
jgi:copper chaperone CopZ